MKPSSLQLVILSALKKGSPKSFLAQLTDTTYIARLPDELKSRWCLLRAIEWSNWPLFMAQPVAPIALIFMPWPKVIGLVIVLGWLWPMVRYRFLSLTLAELGAGFVLLKWPSAIIAAVILGMKGQFDSAIIAALWPLISLLLSGLVPKAPIGAIERVFAYQVIAMQERGTFGSDELSAGMYCPKCSYRYPQGFRNCVECNIRLVAGTPRLFTVRRMSWVMLGLLLFFLGFASVALPWFVIPSGVYPHLALLVAGLPLWGLSYACFRKTYLSNMVVPRAIGYVLALLIALGIVGIMLLADWLR